jgi:hypothetical protein
MRVGLNITLYVLQMLEIKLSVNFVILPINEKHGHSLRTSFL